jgi:hypothetical protein
MSMVACANGTSWRMYSLPAGATFCPGRARLCRAVTRSIWGSNFAQYRMAHRDVPTQTRPVSHQPMTPCRFSSQFRPIQGNSSQKKKSSSTGVDETPGIGSETRPPGPRGQNRFGRSDEGGCDGFRSGRVAPGQTNLEKRPAPSHPVAVCSSDFLLAGRYCQSRGRLDSASQGTVACGFPVSGRANDTLLQRISGYFSLIQHISKIMNNDAIVEESVEAGFSASSFASPRLGAFALNPGQKSTGNTGNT